MEQKQNRKKLYKRIFKGIRIFIIVVIIMFASFICLQRFTNNEFSIFGYRLFSVATGSMAPMYNVGDVLLVREADTSTLTIGDDITYMGNVSSYKDKLVTHRIIEIEIKNGKKFFHTKGIASVSEDPLVSEEQVLGKVHKKLKLLSSLHLFIKTPGGFLLCVVLPILFLIGSEIIQTMLENYEIKRNKLQS